MESTRSTGFLLVIKANRVMVQRYYATELASRNQYVKDVKSTYHRDIVLNGNSLAAQAVHA